MGVQSRVPQPADTRWTPPKPNPSNEKGQCGRCGDPIAVGVGYPHRGAFYCEECIWVLAENGEFYCGD